MATQTAANGMDRDYAHAMGQLLVLYTQVDQFIMEACADRARRAPNEVARRGLLKQVNDERRHVDIQRRWMREFGVSATPVVDARLLNQLHAHFHSLDWVDFLTDLYLVIEALGSQAVEQIVPLADPGTRESLQVPLQDEIDHVAFGLAELGKVLGAMDAVQRAAYIQRVPARIGQLSARLAGLDLPIAQWFNAVGCDYSTVCAALERRKDELLQQLAA